MKYLSLFTIICIFWAFDSVGFKTEQLRYSRVRTAFAEKETLINARLQELDLNTNSLKVFIRAFKKENRLEVWVSNTTTYKLYKSYDFCSTSGSLGPKRQQGDGQIPEGLYYIDRFNPSSNFYLSLGINYPNASDKIRANGQAGGDIFIHGNCVTIGCIPITDDKIKEVYALCVLAKEAGQVQIPVHIFPFVQSIENMEKYNKDSHYTFWQELLPFYSFFENKYEMAPFSIDARGVYKLQ